VSIVDVLQTIADCRAARRRVEGLGFVPTMGFLHDGHLSLVRRARAECGAAAVSIFVNPTQFGPDEDFTRYPRDADRDLALLREAGADYVFLPDVATMYPPGSTTFVDVGGVTAMLEGAVRPGHFRGVATVVGKLFNIVRPTQAYFGQKDAQQCVVIRRMVRDLDMPVEVVVCPTVREADGLAMSSRNAYLKPAERQAGSVLFRALTTAQARFESGERRAEALRRVIGAVLATAPHDGIDYVSVADPETLEEIGHIGDAGALVSLAVRFGATRLIDNLVL
jgi:pantoate--beta-alanine ligase